jgi:hypothetical protein
MSVEERFLAAVKIEFFHIATLMITVTKISVGPALALNISFPNSMIH